MSGYPDDLITLTVSVDALNDLRTAALERMWDEHSQAERLGSRKLKRMAAHAGGLSQRYRHAVQALDYAIENAVEPEGKNAKS